MDLTIPKEVVAAAVPAIPGYVAPQGPEEVVPADIPADLIDADFNYRRRKEKPADWAAFKEDVKARGQMQRVLLRPKPDGRFQLVFGNRRFRALVENEGPNVLVRADVRNLADEDATGMMAAENGQRANPSVIEDAELASRMLGLTKGDRDEAARRLGWNRGLFDRRVALMYACDKVRDAYLEDRLDVGHVEILAALRKEVQEKVITMLLEHETKTGKRCTVPELKGMAAKSLLSLEAAIFDRAECASCRYNTGNQQALFDVSFEGTNCTNKPCYDSKTEVTLEARKAKLAETYQVVRIIRAGDNSTVIPLRADGKRPVGAEQAQACRTCGDFGACVSALPDALGKTYQDVCFNKTCNDAKVETYRQQLEQADKAGQQQGGAEELDVGAEAGADDSQQGGDSDPADEQSTTTKPTRVATASASSVRSAIKDYREAIWRAVFEAAVKKLPMVKNRMLLLAILLHHPSHLNESGAAAAVKKALGLDLGGRTSTKANLSAVLALTSEQLGVAYQLVGAHLRESAPINDVVGYLTALEIRLEDHWKVNETFFEILTKTELDAVCVELGLDKAAGKTYASLRNGSKKDFVAAMLKVNGFKYEGAVPKLMRWTAK